MKRTSACFFQKSQFIATLERERSKSHIFLTGFASFPLFLFSNVVFFVRRDMCMSDVTSFVPRCTVFTAWYQKRGQSGLAPKVTSSPYYYIYLIVFRDIMLMKYSCRHVQRWLKDGPASQTLAHLSINAWDLMDVICVMQIRWLSTHEVVHGSCEHSSRRECGRVPARKKANQPAVDEDAERDLVGDHCSLMGINDSL